MGKLSERYGTPAAVAVAVSLAIGTIGGAAAVKAKLITGSQVKNGSLTGADIKNGSIGKADLAANALTGGATGPTGPAGPAGAAGAAGAAGVAGAIGPSSAKSVSTTVSTNVATNTQIGSLSLDPGSYVVLARTSLSGAVAPAAGASVVTCQLAVGAAISKGHASINDAEGTKATTTASISVQAVQTLAAAGTATFTCSKVQIVATGVTADATVGASDVTITAIKVGAIS